MHISRSLQDYQDYAQQSVAYAFNAAQKRPGLIVSVALGCLALSGYLIYRRHLSTLAPELPKIQRRQSSNSPPLPTPMPPIKPKPLPAPTLGQTPAAATRPRALPPEPFRTKQARFESSSLPCSQPLLKPPRPKGSDIVFELAHAPQKTITPETRLALKSYKDHLTDPHQPACSERQRLLIFQSIRHISWRSAHIVKGQEGIFAEDLMCACSDLDSARLDHPICSQVVLDIIKEGPKETGSLLVDWLTRRPDFQVGLLRDCLAACMERSQNEKKTLPEEAVKALIQHYKQQSWHRLLGHDGTAILPVNHPVIRQAAKIIIHQSFRQSCLTLNTQLTLWILAQPEYDSATFMEWLRLFQQKERDNPAVNFIFPLLEEMVTRFSRHELPNVQAEALDAELSLYLHHKIAQRKGA